METKNGGKILATSEISMNANKKDVGKKIMLFLMKMLVVFYKKQTIFIGNAVIFFSIPLLIIPFELTSRWFFSMFILMVVYFVVFTLFYRKFKNKFNKEIKDINKIIEKIKK